MAKKRQKKKNKKIRRKSKGEATNAALDDFDAEIKRIREMPEGKERDRAFEALGEALKSVKADRAHHRSKKGTEERQKKAMIEAFVATVRKEKPDLSGKELDAAVSAKAQKLSKEGGVAEELTKAEAEFQAKGIDTRLESERPETSPTPGWERVGDRFVTARSRAGATREVPEGFEIHTPAEFKTTADPQPGEGLSEARDAGRVESLTVQQPVYRQDIDPGDTFKKIPGTRPIEKTANLVGGYVTEMWLEVSGQSVKHEQIRAELTAKRKEIVKDTSIGQAFLQDNADIQEGLYGLFHSILIDDPTKTEDQIDDELTQTGGRMFAGAVAEMGALFRDPVLAFEANPLISTISVLPMIALGRNAARVAARRGMQSQRAQFALESLREFDTRIVQPMMAKIARVAGRNPQSQAILDAVLINAKKMEDATISRGQRAENLFNKEGASAAEIQAAMYDPRQLGDHPLVKVLDNPEKIRQIIREIEENLATDDLIAAHFATIQQKGAALNKAERALAQQGDIGWSQGLDVGQGPGPKAGPPRETPLTLMDEPGPTGPRSFFLAEERHKGLPPPEAQKRQLAWGKGQKPKETAPKSIDQQWSDITSFLDEIAYKTEIDKIPMEPTRKGLHKDTGQILRDLENPEKWTDLMRNAVAVAKRERSAYVGAMWQKSGHIIREQAQRQYLQGTPLFGTVEMSPSVRKYLGEASNAPGTAKRKGLIGDELTIAEAAEQSIIIPTPFNNAVRFRIWSETPQWGAWYTIQKAMKASLTSMNIMSGINNFMANLMMQTLHWGENPGKIILEAVELSSQYKKWMMGEDIAEDLVQFFKWAEEEGLAKSTALIDAEIGTGIKLMGDSPYTAALGGSIVGGTIGNLPGAAIGAAAGPILQQLMNKTPLSRLLRAQRDFYDFGDTGFKFQHSWKTYQLNSFRSDLLRPGEYMTIPHSKNGAQRIQRLPEDQWAVNGKVVDPSVVQRTMAESAFRSAQDRMFDYRDTPMYLDMLRSAPLLGIASPFMIWFWKSMDVPFFKKGLITRTFELPGSVYTNSPKIAASKLLQDVAISTRRAFVVNGLRNDMLENRHETRRWMAFSPAAPRHMVLKFTTNPMWIKADDIEQYNAQAAGSYLIQLADSWLHPAPSAEDYEKRENLRDVLHKPLDESGQEYKAWMTRMDDLRDFGLVPQEMLDRSDKYLDQLLRMSRHRADMSDFLTLAGMAGSVWSDAHKLIFDKSGRGERFEGERMYNALSAVIIGGGLSKILKVTMGIASPVGSDPYLAAGFKERASQLSEKVDDLEMIQESIARYSWRQITGLGFRTMFIGDDKWDESIEKDLKPRNFATRGIDRWTNILKESMFGGMKDKIDALRQVRNRSFTQNEEIRKLERAVKIGLAAIDDEKRKWQEATKHLFADYELSKQLREGVGSIRDLPGLTPSEKDTIIEAGQRR